jgi:hypothetical protein
MMKLLYKTALIAALSAFAITNVYADTRDPGVNKRQHRQHARIADGVKSGELTHSEAKALRAEQRAIRAEEREFKADGVLTKGERRELHRDLNESSRDIRREKHDDDHR